MSKKVLESYLNNLFEQDDRIPYKRDPKKTVEMVFDVGVATACVILPGGIVVFAIYKLIRDMNRKCAVSCKDEKFKRLCYHKCNLESLKQAERLIKPELNKCLKTTNPDKCRKFLWKELLKLREKIIDVQIKIDRETRRVNSKK